MRQPSEIDTQLEGFKQFGVPIKSGLRTLRREGGSEAAVNSDLWLHRWAKHACQNYAFVDKNDGIRFLNDCATGVPAFVVGAGPSLDESVEKLQDASARAIIIGTDASYRALLANKIKPDIIISFDCKEEQSLLWEGVPESEIACLFDSCAHPAAIASWKGPVLFYNHWHEQDNFSHKLLPYIFPHIGQLPSAGTVGNMGILAAKLFGCDPIFAVGMDFCYGKRGVSWQYRAADYRYGLDGWTPTEVKVLYDNDERIKRSFELSIGPKSYRIDPELETYYHAAQIIAERFKLKIINTSPESRLADFCETMSIENAIDKYCQSVLQGGRTVLKHLYKIGRVS
jgi:hypothetical protein